MADVTELRMNVVALKRVDPYGKDILASATHVALYTFNSEINEWEKTDVEGALFVYSRIGEPYHGILIMNRLNTNNLVEPVTKGLDLQVQEPFLLYRNARHNIFGIWFYEKDDCRRISTMLTNLIKESDKSPKFNNTENNSEANILTMLSKAQEDFNCNKTPKKNHEPDVTSQSVKEFFAKASGGASHSVPKPTSLFLNPPSLPKDTNNTNQLQPLLQRLMSNPAHRVEHIEKQQRSVTPSEMTAPVTITSATKQKNQNKQANKANNKANRDFKIRPLSSDLANLKCESPEQMNYIESPSTATKQPFFNSSFGAHSPEPRSLSASLCAETPQKPALMPPTMFTSSASKECSFQPAPELPQTPILRNTSTALLDDSVPSVEPLTKNQLLQALNYLIKNDPEFVTKLHEAYVKSFAELVL